MLQKDRESHNNSINSSNRGSPQAKTKSCVSQTGQVAVLGQMNMYCKNLLGQSNNSQNVEKTPIISKSKSLLDEDHIHKMYEVKGVTKRYNKHNDPDRMSAFNYVNASSTANEKALQMRATIL